MNYHFEDFTDNEYRSLLRLAKANWEIINFPDYGKPGRVCLWRHDVDFSMHRAVKLARIEAEEGVQATYYVLLHGKFYNLLEDEVAERLAEILDLGHMLGLHFDAQFYAKSIYDRTAILDKMEFEKQILQHFFNVDVRTFSFHIPDAGGWINVDEQEINGMINAYGQEIKEKFGYCSDSNGYWRFRRLRDVLEAATDNKLQVLTHPELWTPEPMSPWARVKRCVDGRATRQIEWYDDILEKSGRINVR